MDGSGLGARIATYRRRRGLSQAALAGLVGRSESWLSQVERGIRSVDRLSVLLDLARVLHVEVDVLTGRPWRYAPNGSALADGLGSLRRALMSYSAVLGHEAAGSAELPELRARVAETHELYQAARYDDVIAVSHCSVCLNSSWVLSPVDIRVSRSAVFSMLRSSSSAARALDGRSSRSVASSDRMSLSRPGGTSLRHREGGTTCASWPACAGSLPVRSS